MKRCTLTPEIPDILLLKKYKLGRLSLSIGSRVFGRINSTNKAIKDGKVLSNCWLSKRK